MKIKSHAILFCRQLVLIWVLIDELVLVWLKILKDLCAASCFSYSKNVMWENLALPFVLISGCCIRQLWHCPYMKVLCYNVLWTGDPLWKLVFYTARKQVTELDKRYLTLLLDLVNLLILQLSKGFILLCCFHHFIDFWHCSMDWLSILWFYTLLLLATLSINVHKSKYHSVM